MTERLIIRNFAGLENIDIELGRINIFIGPQASGKSVCAKLLYWFKSFVPELLSSAVQGQDQHSFESSFLERFREYFPNLVRSEEHFILRYEMADFFIEVTPVSSPSFAVAQLEYSPFLHVAAVDIRTTVQNMRSVRTHKTNGRSAPLTLVQLLQEQRATDDIRIEAAKQSGLYGEFEQAFIIAGRTFLSSLRGTILTVLANSQIADPLLRDFLRLYEQVKRESLGLETSNKAVFKLAKSIIRGVILIEGDEEYIVTDSKRRIPLANASSGQQEAFSLIIILLNLINIESFSRPKESLTLYIEEPEAHLFPESQRALAQLMAQIYHQAYSKVQYVITTHSPYLLTSFNNLVYAHQVAELLRDQPAELKKLHKIIPKTQHLPLADFRAYGFENGKVKPLINQETGLLTADLIDSASDVTASQFDALLDLDPSLRA